MDNVRFCYNARGSLDETLNHLLASRDLEYCPILLNGYIVWLKAKKIGQNEPGSKLIVHEISPEYFVDTE